MAVLRAFIFRTFVDPITGTVGSYIQIGAP